MFTPFPDDSHAQRQIEDAGPRVLLYSQDNIGLGHIRRTVTVAGALEQRRPDAALLLVTHAALPSVFDLPRNLDVIRLPAVARAGRYPALKSLTRRLERLRQSVLLDIAVTFEPHLLYVDVLPGGVNGELIPALRYLRQLVPPVSLVFATRDLIDSPRRSVQLWKRDGAYELLEDVYDQILIAGSQDVVDFAAEHQLSPAAAAKVRHCGYVIQPLAPADPATVRARFGATDRPFIVVTAGGGVDSWRLMHSFIMAAQLPRLDGIAALVVTGPYLSPGRMATLLELSQNPARVDAASRLTVTEFITDLPSYLNAADVVVMMGGYNTTCEVLSLGKRAIVVPRVVPEEQLVRAQHLSERGLLTLLHPKDLTAATLADAILRRLDDPPPHVTLDFNGAERMADALAGMLVRREA